MRRGRVMPTVFSRDETRDEEDEEDDGGDEEEELGEGLQE